MTSGSCTFLHRSNRHRSHSPRQRHGEAPVAPLVALVTALKGSHPCRCVRSDNCHLCLPSPWLARAPRRALQTRSVRSCSMLNERNGAAGHSAHRARTSPAVAWSACPCRARLQETPPEVRCGERALTVYSIKFSFITRSRVRYSVYLTCNNRAPRHVDPAPERESPSAPPSLLIPFSPSP